MDFSEIETRALQLPREQRSRLIRQLIDSLDGPINESRTASEWLAEAERRAAELDSGKARAVPGDQVMEKAREAVSD